MKKIVWFTFILAFLFTSCGLDYSEHETFSRYRQHEGVTSLTIPGWLISLAARFGDLEKEERALLRSIQKVSVLTLDDQELTEGISLQDEFDHIVAQNPDLEELLKVQNIDELVVIYGAGNKKRMDELYILVDGTDNAIVHIKGRLKAETIAGLVNSESRDDIFSWNN